MKFIGFTVILFLNAIVFGQSAKKLNKQLQANLLVEEQKQDSSYNNFIRQRKVLEQSRKRLEDQMEKVFYYEDWKLREKGKIIKRYLKALEELQVSTKDLFPIGFQSVDSFPDYKIFANKYDAPLRRFVTFKFASKEDMRITKEQKTAEENEILEKLIRKYREATEENVSKFGELKRFTDKLTELEPRMDSLLRVYESRNNEMQEKENLLWKKYQEARENYRLKGPKGFPVAYAEYFWDVHPLPADKQFAGMKINHDPGVSIGEVISGPTTYWMVDEQAYYPDGIPALKSYIRKNLVYPLSAKENGIIDRITMRFVVSETGEISDVKVVDGIPDCPDCEEEAIRFVKSMPRWFPARKSGFYVNSYCNLPLWFEPK